MAVIKFSVDEQKLMQVDTRFVVNYSKNYLELGFTFNEGWENYTKYCVFHYKHHHYEDLLEYDDKEELWMVTVPKAVLHGKGFRFSVYGINHDEETGKEYTITTQQLHLKLFESGLNCEVSKIQGGASDHMIQTILEKIDTKYDSIELSDYELIFTNNEGTVLGTLSLEDLFNQKSDVGHSHTGEDITDLDEIIEENVNLGLRTLRTQILNYGL